MAQLLQTYLQDPFLARLYTEVRRAGAIRSISLDITHRCNIRCKGCYYFEEGMDQHKSPEGEGEFDAFIEREKERGTNFVTIVGGEPSLSLTRIKKIYDNFWMNVATNGIRKIPFEGFERMPIGISVWGDIHTDKFLRGGGKLNIFQKALKNYRDDPRAFWYYTVMPDAAHEIERVTKMCIENGNRVLFNYYCDLAKLKGDYDSSRGFDKARTKIDEMITRYPRHIFMSSYLNQVISTGKLYDQSWGYEVCTSISSDNEVNKDRIKNGNPFSPHFRAYNADLVSTRRCCTGVDRSCDFCYDTWEHFSWIMLNFRKHLKSKREFANWLSSVYLFYLINRIVDFEEGIQFLPEIHAYARREMVRL